MASGTAQRQDATSIGGGVFGLGFGCISSLTFVLFLVPLPLIVGIAFDQSGHVEMIFRVGLVVLAAAYLYAFVRFYRDIHTAPRLRVSVGSDALTFGPRGTSPTMVPRDRVGVVELYIDRRGVQSIDVIATDGAMVGQWETGWYGWHRPKLQRALRRRGYQVRRHAYNYVTRRVVDV